MRLSPFHKHLARLIASGKRNFEIKQEVQISDSRLSVLRANPLIQAEVARLQQLQEDAYNKALEELAKESVAVAKELVLTAKKTVPDATKLGACEAVLDRLAQASGRSSGSGQGEEMIFEQMLRVTKRSSGLGDSADEAAVEADFEEATKDLMQDLHTQDSATEVSLNADPA